jgi:hypothetical protein
MAEKQERSRAAAATAPEPNFGRPGWTLKRPARRNLPASPVATAAGAQKCRRKFLRYFKKGFRDATYEAWERDYKWDAHEEWERELGAAAFRRLLKEKRYDEIGRRAVRIESHTNLIFSFEKMALRDAVREEAGARAFATGLYEFLHGDGSDEARFTRWCDVVAGLPRRQTRVLTWPIATVFGFLAQPDRHIFLKPNVTRRAAHAFGFPFHYQSRPAWPTYASLLAFGEAVGKSVKDLKPRDMIDIQSFIWVLGSDEYPD